MDQRGNRQDIESVGFRDISPAVHRDFSDFNVSHDPGTIFVIEDHPAFRGIFEASISKLESCCVCSVSIWVVSYVALRNSSPYPCHPPQARRRTSKRPPHHGGQVWARQCYRSCQLALWCSLRERQAAEEVIAYAIDELWRDLYPAKSHSGSGAISSSGPKNCSSCSRLWSRTRLGGSSAFKKLEELFLSSERCSPDQPAVEAALEAELLVTSAWGDLSIGQSVRSSLDLAPCDPFAVGCIASFLRAHTAEDTQDNMTDVLVLKHQFRRLKCCHP